MKIVRDSAVRQEPAQPQAVSPEENRFSIRPRQIALFFLWMLAFTLLARGTSGALLPEVQLSTPAPNTITQSLTATGTIQWAAGSLFYLPEGLLVEAVFVSEGEAVQEGDKIAALRREDVEQKLRSLQAELAQKQTEYARLTKPVAADSYDLEKAQQALQAAYQAAENSAAAWAEKEANAGSERDALQEQADRLTQEAETLREQVQALTAERDRLAEEAERLRPLEAETAQLKKELETLRPDAEAHAMLRGQVGAIECEARQRAAELEERSAEKMRKATDLFHQQYQTLMSTFETASVHMTAELRKMEVSLAQLPRTMDQTGAELNQLAAVLDKAARQESAEK